MNPHAEVRAVTVSEKVFQRLLSAYPQAHRAEYGAAMAQLFRDQCRDAWRESRGWGITKLWLRVLPDVVRTSCLEHLETLKERKFMLNQITSLFRIAQSFKFFTVFTAVFLLVVITATVVTFILPESYVGIARINIQREGPDIRSFNQSSSLGFGVDSYFIQTEFEVMQSQVLLGQVVEDPKLNLKERWATKFNGGALLKTAETVNLLKHFIELRPVRNTSLIEIRTYSDSPHEAAELASAIAYAYRDYCLEKKGGDRRVMVVILDKAAPNPIPVRPNKPLNIAVGVILGTLLGLLAGGAVAGISFLRRHNSPPKIVT